MSTLSPQQVVSIEETITELRPRQRQVLMAIGTLSKEYGYPPSIQQLCQTCGLRSTSSMHYHLTALKKLGLIGWDTKKKRSVCLVPAAVRVLAGGSSEGGDSVRVLGVVPADQKPLGYPLLGTIAAGSPLQTVEDSVEWLALEPHFLPPGCYALKVKGFSMVEDHILDGDVVIINPKATVQNGDVVVALVDQDQATLKRIYREADHVRLQPANSEMQPIYSKHVTVQGKVESILRKIQ